LFLQKRFKRERAFDLAHIESDLEEEELRKARWEQSRAKDFALFRDKMCQDKCNDNLRRGLDMVKTSIDQYLVNSQLIILKVLLLKAHVAFGSIGVPPLVDGTDLKFFCRLDNQHSRCLHDCGFAVQFNMHDFICKRYYLEVVVILIVSNRF
uniref:Clathrin light chain n=1 Tax=Gongylonema pulchrum TaxID=637853 RepID=A0A183D7C3_9BILA